MKPSLLLMASLLLGLSACSEINATEARRYSCDLEDPASRCPGGWRCTLDHFCADPDAGLELTCDRNEDCLGGWLCALTGKCVDPLIGRPLPCDVKEDCPGQWKCSVIGQCVNPDAGQPWPCDVEDDCTGGWHCGVRPVCYDRAAATDVECRRDAGVEDCAPGWRCGLEEVCHDRSVGAPLRCDLDEDCEQLWRCDTTHHCVDSSLDALRDTSDGGRAVAAPLPSFIPRNVELTSVTSKFSGPNDSLRAAAFIGDGKLTVALFGAEGFAHLGPDGGGTPVALVGQVTAPAGATALTLSPELPLRAWVTVGQSLFSYRLDQVTQQLALEQRLDIAFAPTGLRALPKGAIAAFDAKNITVRMGDGTVRSDAGVLLPLHSFPPASAAKITDVVLVPGAVLAPGATTIGSEDFSLLVLSSGGDQAFSWSDFALPTNKQPVTLDPSGKSRVERLAVLSEFNNRLVLDGGPEVLGVAVTQPSPTLPNLALATLQYEVAPPTLGPDGGARGFLTAPHDSSRLLRAAGVDRETSCVGDVPGFMVHPTRDGGTAWSIHCVVDGGALFEVGTPGVGREAVAGSAEFQFSRDSAQASIIASREQAWIDEGEGFLMRPLVPSEPVIALAGRATAPVLATQARPVRPVDCLLDGQPSQCETLITNATCASGGTPWLWCFPMPGTFQSVGTRVTGKPDWWFFDVSDAPPGAVPTPYFIGGIDLQRADLTYGVGTSSLGLGTVGGATTVTTPDGGSLLIVAGSDRLFWGDVSVLPTTAAGLYAGNTLRFATTPQPGAVITSLTTIPVDLATAGARFAEGYLVAAGRVYRYAADNEVVWRTEELSLSPAEAITVWGDERRGRVIYRDGTVFGLPSRVQLTAPLTPSASSVIEVESWCGQTFALTTSGLYQLTASGADLGAWTAVELGGVPLATLRQGHLLAEEQALLLVLPGGQSRRVTGFSCLR